MFSLWKFRRTFGFYSGNVRNPARVKLIQLRLNQLKAVRDGTHSQLLELEAQLAEVTTVAQGIALSRQVAKAEKADYAADYRLYQACELAVRYKVYEVYDLVAQLGYETLVSKEERVVAT